jgi:hypothetical protein
MKKAAVGTEPESTLKRGNGMEKVNGSETGHGKLCGNILTSIEQSGSWSGSPISPLFLFLRSISVTRT